MTRRNSDVDEGRIGRALDKLLPSDAVFCLVFQAAPGDGQTRIISTFAPAELEQVIDRLARSDH